jgi:hypothetical protein
MHLITNRETSSCAATYKFPAFYGTRRFITALTKALHWSLSWAKPIQSMPSLPGGLFSSGFPTYNLYMYLFSLFMLHALPISSSLNWSFLLYSVKSTYHEACYAILSTFPSLHPSSVQTPSVYVPPLMPETKFHTHTEPHTQFIVLNILIFTFLDSRQKVRDWMVTSITRIQTPFPPESNFDFLPSFPNIWTVTHFQMCYYFYVIILTCILVTGQQHILSLLYVYF